MKKTLRKYKMIFILIIAIVMTLYFSIFLFLQFNPAFGGKLTSEQKIEFEKLDNFHKGKFINQIPTSLDMNFADGIKTMREMGKDRIGREPGKQLPIIHLDPRSISKKNTNRVTWFGHSTFLVELDGKIILIDPMFSQRTSPIPFIGPKRYTMEFPIELENLPEIDVVLISHDHYDHLDMQTIKALKNKTKKFIVPLGVDNHLKRWKIEPQKIEALNWWDETINENMTFISTPARHFSGRSTSDRAKTLWTSWIIQSHSYQLYYSGDTSYGPHFKEINKKFGEMDLALLECGQYNIKWKNVHMFPEETAQAALDLQAKLFMPIHWSGFTLSVHHWTEPVERAWEKAEKLKMNITTPKIGESILLKSNYFPKDKWWKEI